MGGGSALDAALAALGAAAAVAEVAQLEHRQAHHYARVHSEALDGYRLLAAGDAAVPEHVHRVVLLAQTPKLATTGPVGDLALFSSLSFLDVSGNALPLAPLGTLPALEHLMLACNGLRGADLVPIPASEPGGAQEHDDNYNAAAAVAALAVRSGGGGAHTGAGAFADVAADSGGAAVSGRARRALRRQRRLVRRRAAAAALAEVRARVVARSGGTSEEVAAAAVPDPVSGDDIDLDAEAAAQGTGGGGGVRGTPGHAFDGDMSLYGDSSTDSEPEGDAAGAGAGGPDAGGLKKA